MPRYNRFERDIVQVLSNKIDALERRVKHLENAHTTSVHIQDKASLPPNLTEGMIFIATDNTFCWVRANTVRFISGTILP